MDEEDDVGPAVTVDVAEGDVSGLERVEAVAKGFPLEDFEAEPAAQVARAGKADDLKEMLGGVGQHEVDVAIAVHVTGDQVGEAGIGAGRLIARQRLQALALAAGREDAEAVCTGDEKVFAAIAVEVGNVHPLEVDRAE